MAVDDEIRDEKLQYDIKREVTAKERYISPEVRQKSIDEYLTCEEILSLDQTKMLKQDKFTYSTLKKALEKQIKTIEDQGNKQVETLNV